MPTILGDLLDDALPNPLSLLVISYYFPPSAEVGARRVAQFCRYLPDFGISPTVLTTEESSSAAVDSGSLIPARIVVRRAKPRTTLLQRYRNSAVRRASTSSQRPVRGVPKNTAVSNQWRRHIIALLDYPDPQHGWYYPAVSEARQIAEAAGFDAVLSSGPPWTCHAIANTVARRLKLPWIADFRDEWASSPWRNYFTDGRGMPSWRTKLDLWTEGLWMRRAALTICNTTRQRESVLRVHQKADHERVVTVTNGLDIDSLHLPSRTPRSTGKRVLFHAGTLYAGRRIDTFCVALKSLIARNEVPLSDIQVVLMGPVEGDIETRARSAAGELFDRGVVTFKTRLPWHQAQQEMQDADVLLIFQGEHPTAIPAKFFEYLVTGKPILAIAGEGALREIVLQTNSGCVADPNDANVIAAAIRTVLQMGVRSAAEIEDVARQFDYRQLTEQLATHIRTAVGTFNNSRTA